ncbi:pep-cterm sorting domain-containing protein [Anaeramoeba flamelloides]|uniref:Pep-cterm sorting domain-containing protein n=1 Tax=Anaeramoeba flamelloides TaxID=1746091 RepID=A0AAV8AGQ9_9EUKA|nr:pep-cterm sorting domain-containing protein [Anaeramoeba flamelloides]
MRTSSIKRDLKKIINSSEIADVHFVVGPEKYLMYGHKMILSLNSKYFLEKFYPTRPLSSINGKVDQLINNKNLENDNTNTKPQTPKTNRTNLQLNLFENEPIREEEEEEELKEQNEEEIKEKEKDFKIQKIYFNQFQYHCIITIEEPEIDCKPFEKFLNFFYTKKANITPSDAWSILYCAQKYQVPDLIKITIDYILSIVSKDTVLCLLEKSIECEQWYLYLKILDFFKTFAVEIFSKARCLNKLINKMVPLLLQSVTDLVPSSTVFKRLLERIKYKYQKLKIPINTVILASEIRPLQKFIKFETFSMKSLRSVMNSGIISDQLIFGVLLKKFEQIEKVCINYQPKEKDVMNNKQNKNLHGNVNGNVNVNGKTQINNKKITPLENPSVANDNNNKNQNQNFISTKINKNSNKSQNYITEKLELIHKIDKELIENSHRNNNIDQNYNNLENEQVITMRIEKEKENNMLHHIDLLNLVRTEYEKAKKMIIDNELNNNELKNEKEKNTREIEREKELELTRKRKEMIIENENETEEEDEVKEIEIEIDTETETETDKEKGNEKEKGKGKKKEKEKEIEIEKGKEKNNVNNKLISQRNGTLPLKGHSPLQNTKFSFFASKIALLANDPHVKWRRDVSEIIKKCNIQVVTFNLTSRIPKLTELKKFKLIFHYSTNAYKNPKKVGDLLGILVEMGIPLIICSCFAFHKKKSRLEGKITHLQMLPNFEEAELSETYSEIGTKEDHEIMQGIHNFEGGAQSYRFKKIKNIGKIIARWRDRSVLVTLFERDNQFLNNTSNSNTNEPKNLHTNNNSANNNSNNNRNLLLFNKNTTATATATATNTTTTTTTNNNNNNNNNNTNVDVNDNKSKNQVKPIVTNTKSNLRNIHSKVIFLNFFPVSRRVWKGEQKPWFSQNMQEKFHVGGDKIIQNSVLFLLKEKIFDMIKQQYQRKNELIEKKKIQKQKIFKRQKRKEKKIQKQKLDKRKKRKEKKISKFNKKRKRKN